MKSGFALVFLFSVSFCAAYAQIQDPVSTPGSDAATAQAARRQATKASQSGVKKKDTEDKDDPATAYKQQILDLLERSHAVNEEVLPEQRGNLLARQISMVSRLNTETAEKWAQELFQLGEDQSDEKKRASMQIMAIQMIAQGDPEFGLKLLHQLRPVAETDGSALYSANLISIAAGAVFRGLARDKGESQLPRLRQEALRLAAESQYPYSAMAGVAVELVRDQRHDGSRQETQAGSVVESVFDEAVSIYQRSVPTWSANADFGRMLQRMAYQLPHDKVRQALDGFVNNVQSTPAPSLSVELASGSRAIQLSDPVEIALYEYVPLLNQFDPELMKQLVQAHPKLAKADFSSSPSWGYKSPVNNGSNANQTVRLRAQGMASWNPDRALALTQGITDPNTRAVTMGSVAEQIAGDDSGRAMQLLDQAQKTAGDSQDLKTELQLLASKAQVAEATNNSAMLRDSLRQGFEIGDQFLRQEQDDKQEQVSWYMLGSLVQTGIKSDPDLTLSYINSFSLPYVRAELLLDAAQALRFKGRRVSHTRNVHDSAVVN